MYKYLILVVSLFFMVQTSHAQSKANENNTIKSVKKELHKGLDKTSKLAGKTWGSTKKGSKKIYKKAKKSGKTVLKKVKKEAPKKWDTVKKGTLNETKKLKKKIHSLKK